MSTRDKIIEGARDFLIKFGQPGFTVRAIAKHAGVNHGLVHHYFKSKENLIMEIIDSVDQEFNEKMAESVLSKDFNGIKEKALKNFLGNPDFNKLIISLLGFGQIMPQVADRLRLLMQERRRFIQKITGNSDLIDSSIFLAILQGIVFQHSVDSSIPIKGALDRFMERFIEVEKS